MALELEKVKLTKDDKTAAAEALRNWHKLSAALDGMSRDEVRKLLAYELSEEGAARLAVVTRLAARFGMLVREEIEAEATAALAARKAKR